MPIPKTRDIGKIMRFLKKEKPSMSQKRRLAIALSTARKAGKKIKAKKRSPLNAKIMTAVSGVRG